jgi:prepilin-type N-terminal cleavage/methylation domain-containing protein
MKTKGFTVVELLITFAILGIISSIIIFSFSSQNSSSSLEKDASRVVSILNQARSLTLSSKENASYGVHFEEGEVILFKDSYVEGNSENITTSLNSLIMISGVSLSGGVEELVYERFSGEVDATGTVTLSLIEDPTQTKVINIHETGLSEIN